MNKFNRGTKGRNNVKAKRTHRKERRKDKALAGAAAAVAAATLEDVPAEKIDLRRTLTPGAKRARAEKLAVSGKRTGKSFKKGLRVVQRNRKAVLESGLLSMEDIVMYASTKSEGEPTADKASSDLKQDAAQSHGNIGPSPLASSKVLGIRVKPSKKARLRLKRPGLSSERPLSGEPDAMVE